MRSHSLSLLMVNLVPSFDLCVRVPVCDGEWRLLGELLVQLFLEPSPESRYSRGMLSLSSCPLFLSLSYSLCLFSLPSFTSHPSPHWCSPLSSTYFLHLSSNSLYLYICSPFTPHSPSFPLLSPPRLLCYRFLLPPHSL